MPILTYESDGYAISPSVLRQVDVHVQQVIEHAARNRQMPPTSSKNLSNPRSN
jgi:hypothetical protein